VVILSGDHIYKMDYRPMLRLHEERRADLTVAVMNVAPEETSRFGIVLTDETGRVTQFLEKPKEPPSTLANMGVYIFNASALAERMQALAPQHPDLDFGKHVIPSMVESHAIYSYPFVGYWVDVGTIEAYWQTSMELTSGESKLNLYDPSWVIHTKSEERPPARMRVLASVALPRTRCTPLTSTAPARRTPRSLAPSASCPINPTALTSTPSAARFWAALPAPPGASSLRSKRTMRTGASRLIRSVSP